MNLDFRSNMLDGSGSTPTCLVSTIQAAGGVMVWRMHAWHALCSLIPIEHRLNARVCLTIVADFLKYLRYLRTSLPFQFDPIHVASILRVIRRVITNRMWSYYYTRMDKMLETQAFYYPGIVT